MENLLRDPKFGLRLVARNPGFSAVAKTRAPTCTSPGASSRGATPPCSSGAVGPRARSSSACAGPSSTWSLPSSSNEEGTAADLLRLTSAAFGALALLLAAVGLYGVVAQSVEQRRPIPLAVALLVNLLPARRAARVDPLVALRCE